MPAQSHYASLARQWELLQSIPRKQPGKTVLELKQALADAGYSVDKRTVQRDLTDLFLIFPLRCNDDAEPYQWHWLEGKQLELPAIDVSEAQILLLVKDLLKPLVPSSLWNSLDNRFATATRKLEALAKDNALARWSDKVRAVPNALPLLPPSIDPMVLATAQEALMMERQLTVMYHGFGATTPKEQTLHPLALLQCGPVTYLVATAFDYDDPRLYALHRIHRAGLLESSIRKPPSFTLDSYIANGAPQFGSGEHIQLEAKVITGLGTILSETPLSPDMQLTHTDEDWWTLTASVQDTWQLRWWILSQGADIVVRKPKALRRDLMSQLKASLDNYRDRAINR